jgi:hypothetical protein
MLFSFNVLLFSVLRQSDKIRWIILFDLSGYQKHGSSNTSLAVLQTTKFVIIFISVHSLGTQYIINLLQILLLKY